MRDLHRRRVANQISHKAAEFEYFLRHVVNGASECLRSFRAGEQHDQSAEARRAVIYGFSAFCNAMQGLKDSIKTATGEHVSWSAIATCRHGEFIYEARNASTHDGHPIVNGYVDGQLQMVFPIERYDDKGIKRDVPPPVEDVPTVCLQFAKDFCELLVQRLTSHLGREELRGSAFTVEQLDAVASLPVIPEFARELMTQSRPQTVAHIEANANDPMSSVLEKLTEIRDDVERDLEAQS